MRNGRNRRGHRVAEDVGRAQDIAATTDMLKVRRQSGHHCDSAFHDDLVVAAGRRVL